MQQILNVLTPADTYDLVSLEQIKTALLISATDSSKDALLQMQITQISEMIAKLCNRVFGYEEVDETFYQLNDECSPPTRRLYLSRWPVLLDDIETFTMSKAPGDSVDMLPALATGDWVLEEQTGTLYRREDLGAWYGTVDVVYSGGYHLPDDTPGLVQFAVQALIRESYMAWIRNPALFGVRQIGHKEARIGYFGPNMFPTLGLPETWKTVEALLQKYIRHWV
jgi:hypothetical protein